jgi:hypothetical protein
MDVDGIGEEVELKTLKTLGFDSEIERNVASSVFRAIKISPPSDFRKSGWSQTP